MEYSVRSTSLDALATDCLVVTLSDKKKLDPAAETVDRLTGGLVKQVLASGDLNGACGRHLTIPAPPGLRARRLLLLGLGDEKKLTFTTLGKALAAVVGELDEGGSRDLAVALPRTLAQDQLYGAVRDAVLRMESALYRFDTCKGDKKPPRKPLRRCVFIEDEAERRRPVRKAVTHGRAIAAGMALARDLANLPGNICTPDHLAREAGKLGRRYEKLKVSALTEKQMERLGMGALLSVSRGSRQEARLIVMEYQGGKAGARPVVLVGKGLTFDAGGISLKPAANMDEMKYDMCGGAGVIGTLLACAELDLPLNVVGLVPASENLPDGNANKPGDIVTSMAGITIEILNTDAEGRLILADALTYAERFKPAAVIDVATLTGACVVALGHHISGLLGNDDALVEAVQAAGDAIDDRAWRLPMGEDYQKQLESPFADLANIGGRSAGTITAACFLSRFAEKYKWAHLDIAGTAWKSGGKEKGATGRPVPLLTQFLLQRAGRLP